MLSDSDQDIGHCNFVLVPWCTLIPCLRVEGYVGFGGWCGLKDLIFDVSTCFNNCRNLSSLASCGISFGHALVSVGSLILDSEVFGNRWRP